MRTIGGHVDKDGSVSGVAVDSVVQQYENEMSTLMAQLHGARQRQTRILLETLDDSKQLRQRLTLSTRP